MATNSIGSGEGGIVVITIPPGEINPSEAPDTYVDYA